METPGETGIGIAEEPPPAPKNELRGLDIPYCLRIHMKDFPAKPRVMMKKQMMKFVYQVYWDKVAVDDVRRKDGMGPQTFGESLALYLGKKYGLQKLADHKIAEIVETCMLRFCCAVPSFAPFLTYRPAPGKHYRDPSKHLRINIFGKFLGCYTLAVHTVCLLPYSEHAVVYSRDAKCP